MYCKPLVVCLVAGAFTAPTAFGQSIQENNSDTVDRTARGGKGPDLRGAIKTIVADTNKFRHDHGRDVLRVNDDLARAAQDFAEFMARTDKYGHEADGKKPWQRIAGHGYAYCIAAENIAWVEDPAGFTTEKLARDFFEGWKNSPPHRKNMLDGDLTEFGIGIAHSRKTGRYYAVQDFGRPKSLEIIFKISNESKATVRYRVDDKEFTLEPDYTRTHERCRSPKVTVELPGQAEDSRKEQVVHPRRGAHYTIRRTPSGGLTLEKESGS